ncbi:type II toxin-antitoxin system RelE/ParE family toxin [Azonexus sp.]|uniref:type II toxin-antitoxin system RelE/ParE family toxin n=1 Tax=Azonexus sp. TaxID=1872668 RepID=UPI0027BB004F|nr:type II toxin-antitoxin system RelE/ParE family toxin [Azonexus sp.]
MRIRWTEEALADLEEIVVFYYLEASPRAAAAVERRIINEIESLPPFPERIRESDRIPGARELIVNKLPYVVFVQMREDVIIVLNVVHTKRHFPQSEMAPIDQKAEHDDDAPR